MMKNKWYLIVALLIVSALALAACGGSAGEPTTAPVEEPVVEPTEEPMEEPTEEPTEAPVEEEPTEAPGEEDAVEPAAEEETDGPLEEVLTECAPSDERLVVWADETRSQLMVDLGDDFLAEYGVCLEVTQIGFGDIRDRVKIVAPAGEGPDVFIGA